MKRSKYIDHTLLKPEATKEQIKELCQQAMEYDFASVCVNPYWVSYCAQLLKESDVMVCTVIGFPLGANTSALKAFETKEAIENGADEVDMVINIGELKAGNDKAVLEDIKAVVQASEDKTVKVILETCLLSDDEIGSYMTTNFVSIKEDSTIRQAMKSVVEQAGENDNIMTIYVLSKEDTFCGAIALKDLICARQNDALEDLIVTSYPYVSDREKISDCIEWIKDYAEDSYPVLNSEMKILGIITAQDIIEVVDDVLSSYFCIKSQQSFSGKLTGNEISFFEFWYDNVK